MKYCGKCKRLFADDSLANCKSCGRRLISDPSHYSPVYLITANGFEFERIRSAIGSAEIPYSYHESVHDAGIQILNSAAPENCDIFVPLSSYADARDILAGIGAWKEEDILDFSEDDEEKLRKAKKTAEQEPELSPRKAAVIRIVSMIVFLGVLVGVAFLSDLLIGLIKGLF